MTTPKGYTDCEQIAAYYALYPIPVAALLWCSSPPNQIQDHLNKAEETKVRGVFSLPYMPCFTVRCRALHEAIENGKLKACREKGVVVDEHVAPERRHVWRADLKEWMAKEFPGDKPAFLFDEVERKMHSAISTEAYQALKADRDAKNTELRNTKQQLETFRVEREALKSCMEKMTAAAEISAKTPTLTEYQTLLKLVIGMAIDAACCQAVCRVQILCLPTLLPISLPKPAGNQE